MGKSFSKAICISKLSPAVQADVRRQLGDKAFDALVVKESHKRGRYTVGAKERRTCDGILFDSSWECDIYQSLRDRIGKNFSLQPRFLLQEAFTDVEGKRNQDIEYVADFLIGPLRASNTAPVGPQHAVVEAKGFRTVDYRIKKKLFLYRYRPRFFEVRTPSDVDKLFAFLGTQNLQK